MSLPLGMLALIIRMSTSWLDMTSMTFTYPPSYSTLAEHEGRDGRTSILHGLCIMNLVLFIFRGHPIKRISFMQFAYNRSGKAFFFSELNINPGRDTGLYIQDHSLFVTQDLALRIITPGYSRTVTCTQVCLKGSWRLHGRVIISVTGLT